MKGADQANIDIAPTILEAAGVPEALSMEGRSVLDGTRERVLIEGVARGRRTAAFVPRSICSSSMATATVRLNFTTSRLMPTSYRTERTSRTMKNSSQT